MISKKLSARKLFGRLLRQEYLHKIWTGGIICVVLIFAFPVNLALYLGQYTEELTRMPEDLLVQFISDNYQGFVCIYLIGLLLSMVEFGYLFRRDKVDFYHALPVSRSIQFSYRYLNGVIQFVFPFLIFYAITVLIAIGHGVMIVGQMLAIFRLCLMYLLFFILMYTVSVMGMLLAGSYLSALMVIFLLHFAGPVFCWIITRCERSFFRTFVNTGDQPLFGQGSIVTICIKTLEDFKDNGYVVSHSFTLLVILGILLLVLAYVLFWKRPTEKTGCGLAYPVIQPLIQCITVVGGGMLAGLFLQQMSFDGGDRWLFFGMIAGCIVMHMILQMIFQLNFRAFFQGKLQMLFCTALALLFMCVFRFDLLGYDQYFPAKEQLESVGISITNLEAYRTYLLEGGTFEYDESGWDVITVSSVTQDEKDLYQSLRQMNLKNTRPVLDIAQHAIQDKSWDRDKTNITICYRLKEGKCIYRSYKMDLDQEEANCSEIFAMDAYKEFLYPVLARGEENITVQLNSPTSTVKKKLNLKDVSYISLLRTYKRELKELSYEQLKSEEPLLNLEFTEDDYRIRYNSYPVYPSFKHTLTLLKGYGYEFQPIRELIYRADVTLIANEQEDVFASSTSYASVEGSSFVEGTSSASTEAQKLQIKDSKKLKKIIPNLVDLSARMTNLTLEPVDETYSVTGYYHDVVTGEELPTEFYFKKDTVPDFVRSYFTEEAAKSN